VPVSVVVANLTTFVASLPVLYVMLFIFKAPVTFSLLTLPIVIVFQVLFTLGIVLLTASLHTYYRDIKYLVEVMLIVLFYLSPIFYTPEGLISRGLLDVYMLNPLACMVTLYRQILMQGCLPDVQVLVCFMVSSGAVFLTGLWVFRQYEVDFADVV